ncbi:MAG: hypothetical protein ACAI35_18205 [Candidatus Methylacidiphilales bacterium]
MISPAAQHPPESSVLDSWPWLRAHWFDLNIRCGIPFPVAESQAATLVSQYQAPGRHYHNLSHIESCLRLLEEFHGFSDRQAFNRFRIAWALWFHDCIDDRFDKAGVGKCSAAAGNYLFTYARTSILLDPDTGPDSGYDLKDAFVASVRGLVLATDYANGAGGIASLPRHDFQLSLLTDEVIGIMRDIDLATLGASPEIYAQYAANIRREYAHVEDALYSSGRARVLRTFLELPDIYASPWFRDRFESSARANLAFELSSLR